MSKYEWLADGLNIYGSMAIGWMWVLAGEPANAAMLFAWGAFYRVALHRFSKDERNG